MIGVKLILCSLSITFNLLHGSVGYVCCRLQNVFFCSFPSFAAIILRQAVAFVVACNTFSSAHSFHVLGLFLDNIFIYVLLKKVYFFLSLPAASVFIMRPVALNARSLLHLGIFLVTHLPRSHARAFAEVAALEQSPFSSILLPIGFFDIPISNECQVFESGIQYIVGNCGGCSRRHDILFPFSLLEVRFTECVPLPG